MVVWRLTTHHKNPESHLAQAKEHGRIAIGWNSTDDLRDYASEAEIKRAVRNTGHRNYPSSGRQLLAFRDEMKPGDLVILSTRDARRRVMRIEGDYEFTPQPAGDDVAYAHGRAASVTDLNPNEVWKAAGGVDVGQSMRWTLVRCRHEVTSEGERIVVTAP